MADMETWLNEGAVKRQLHYYVDELIREAIKTEMQSLDFSMTVKKLVHEEVRKYLGQAKVQDLLKG